jgi:retron-type reverse transcriptase
VVDRSKAPVTPLERPVGARRGAAAVGAAGKDTPVGAERVMDRVVERANRLAALRRVTRHGGRPGIDGMAVAERPGSWREPGPPIREALLAGTYRPLPVTRVAIPPPGGGVRQRGLPTGLDRGIQPAILPALQPEWDHTGSDGRDGCRARRSAHQARAPAPRYRGEG